MAVRTREIYRNANGDRWLLACDPDTARVFVRHEPNPPSGGQVADIEIGAFLIAAGNGPEKQELVRLLERWSEVRLRRGPAWPCAVAALGLNGILRAPVASLSRQAFTTA